jgi:hypothetical protein
MPFVSIRRDVKRGYRFVPGFGCQCGGWFSRYGTEEGKAALRRARLPATMILTNETEGRLGWRGNLDRTDRPYRLSVRQARRTHLDRVLAHTERTATTRGHQASG